MKKIILVPFLGCLSLAIFGCTTIPEKSELQRLDGETLRAALIGNTYTRKPSWGRYAEYFTSGGTSYAKAWGASWSQTATSEYEISPDGELCAVFHGDPEWAGGKEYCSMMYTDTEGNYYSEVTQDAFKPQREGKMRSVEIKPGDEYGLGT